MAGKHAIEVIDLSELWYVCGGVDKQTQEAQAAIDQATSAVQNLASNMAPKDTGMTDMLMKVLSNRRSGSGPGSAPALPPTSTLTR
jgi:hypothetical protein